MVVGDGVNDIAVQVYVDACYLTVVLVCVCMKDLIVICCVLFAFSVIVFMVVMHVLMLIVFSLGLCIVCP